MDESRPATAAPPDATPPEERPVQEVKPRRGRWRPRVPTAVLVTFAGIALTAWLLPAFTRQWEERQRALDLKTSLVTEISTTTGLAVTSAEAQFERYTGLPADYPWLIRPSLELRRIWLRGALPIEAKLRAYFDEDLLGHWNEYDRAMRSFLMIAGVEGLANKAHAQAEREGRPYSLVPIARTQIRHWLDDVRPMTPEDRRGLGDNLISQSPIYRSAAFQGLEAFVLDREAAFTNRLLTAHLRGFSTTRRDLIKDLLP